MYGYFVLLMHCIGKPAGIMDKSNADWFSTLELGHSKINSPALQAISERAAQTSQRIKNITQRNSNIIQEHVQPSNSSDVNISRTVEMEVQTDHVVFNTQSTQTERPPIVCYKAVQTKDNDFFLS